MNIGAVVNRDEDNHPYLTYVVIEDDVEQAKVRLAELEAKRAVLSGELALEMNKHEQDAMRTIINGSA